MGMLLNRLLIIIIEEDSHSTNYHIAMTLLKHFDKIINLSINEIGEICNVSKSTISKFIRHIGFDDYFEFKDAAPFSHKQHHSDYSYNLNVMGYIESHSFDDYLDTINQDVEELKRSIDTVKVDQLAKDIMNYETVAAFGLLYSETAAIDLQTKLAYNEKFINTSMYDVKQHDFIRNANEDTLIIIFSYSGDYLYKYQMMDGDVRKNAFDKTKAKIVVITANKEVEKDPRVDYCIAFPSVSNISTHSILYPIITDYLVLRYRHLKGLVDS